MNRSSPSTPARLYIGIAILILGNLAILSYAAYNSEALIEPRAWLKRHSLLHNERLRYRVLLFLLPLYSRISGKNIEKDIHQQNIRGRIYQHIKEHPGVNFTGVREEMTIGNGTAIYHLTVLQREGYVRSSVSGNRKLFWVKSDFPGTESAALTALQQRIVELLTKHGKMARKDIMEKLEVSASTLHPHLKELAESGMLVEEKIGKGHYCSLNE